MVTMQVKAWITFFRKKTLKSAESLRAYQNELMREVERNQMKQVHEEKDGRVSPNILNWL